YFTGSLTILDERATNPASKLDISYERNQLFQLEKKTILGMRAEYDLGGRSYLGGTFLYLNESTLDQKVRVGRGPIRNLVWDINTRLNLNPNFIGKAFDFLPILRAKGESSLDFEGEIAQVLPTPNTLNNKKTGDNHGVAYIDDFEGAKKTVNLGVLRKNWSRASKPVDKIHTIQNMVNYIWYNPFQQVFIQDIYPEREINPNVPNRVHVLTFQLFPDQNNRDPNTWGGVMRALSPGVFDQSQTKFIEVMVQGDEGRLHIDLGTISEDVIPNNELDTEDERVGGFRNGILDDGEDLGIDGIAKPDPPELNYPRNVFVGDSINAVPFDFWDIPKEGNRKGIKDADEPWSYDDWYYIENSIIYIQEDKGSIIGTENNANDEGGRRPDTEDINGNGILDRANSYFSYSFSLNKSAKDTSLIVGGNPPAGWFLYRIPFDIASVDTSYGSPNVTQIEYVRIWVDEVEDFSRPLTFRIAEINMVGSEWKELGTTDDEFNFASLTIQSDSTVAITQINTHENAEYAASLRDIGVEGEEDKVTRVRAREQSLVLKAIDLKAQNAGIAQKSLFQGENYIHYERIKMFVYGRPQFPNNEEHIPYDTSSVNSSQLEYFFRFGADINNYYEYRSTVYEGWNDKNHMDIGLQEFTSIDRTDSTIYEIENETYVKYLVSDRSKSIRVKGNPSLTNIKTLILGIKNKNATQAFTGEVWFNELRLSDVEREKGVAMRFRANMKIANFATINGEVERKDADFHNVAQRFGSGNNSLSTSLNASFKLDNFFPQSWGISMPLTLNYRNSKSTPKYFPGKDRLVTGDLSAEELEAVRSVRNQNGFNISFRRQIKSKNFFLKNTIDNLTFSLGRSQNSLENPTTKFSKTRAWTGNMDYRIDFGKKNYISLLSWLPNLPLISKVKGTKFYYTPQNIAFRVNGSKTDQKSQNRIQDISRQDSVAITETETFNVDRSVRTNMKVFESLTLDYSRTNKADMRGAGFVDFFKGNFEDINIAQTFSARYNPRIFSWLNNSFNYSANYSFNNNIQQRTTGKSARASTTRSADFTLRFQQFVKSIFGGGSKSTGRPGVRGKPGGRSKPGEKGPGPNKNKLIFLQ
ncbi:MAG: cell surface protein SprA, partial [bacterium]